MALSGLDLDKAGIMTDTSAYPATADLTPPSDPWELFEAWFQDARNSEINDPNAMTLATRGVDDGLSARIVLMKMYDKRGFVFFTNRQSRKGHDLAAHAEVALCFHWKSLQRQVRVEGHAAQISDTESDAYFAGRPRLSQIGAWASQQSAPLVNRKNFDDRVAELEKMYDGKEVPRPPHWGGYRVTPRRIEFWQDRAFRLHDRFLYSFDATHQSWSIERLYP